MPDDHGRRSWVSPARQLAGPLLTAAGGLRHRMPSEDAEALLEACLAVLRWLEDHPPPRGCRRAGAELRAAAGVLRNAAFAHRSLAEATDAEYEARRGASEALLVQGRDHVEAFLALTD